jgi:hypothetical protein
MSNKQRHWLLVLAALVMGAVASASIAYAQFNPQPDPPARSKTKTNDLKLKNTKGGDDKSIRKDPIPAGDKSPAAGQPQIQTK